ncbi:hypothetical protein BDZ91DRAFT_848448 [Kalaharituber pfeilii]|nr:hypothetical protein BDZ91DRAFT_848448 [Kalaharituber pfeilii]
MSENTSSILPVEQTLGYPDANGIYPSQYIIGKHFVMPFPGGGKNAIAVPRSQEIYITSLYTILVTAIFAAWWITITIGVRYLSPKRLMNQYPIAVVATWKITEPVQASIVMLKCCYDILTAYWIASKSIPPAQLEFPWINFTITIVILLAAIGTVLGGVVAGVILPSRFVIGNAAPANPYTVFFMNLDLYLRSEQSAMKGLQLFQLRGPASRAIATVDSGSLQQQLTKSVLFEQIETPPPDDRSQETSYTMTYTITMTGHEMGLQHASDLTVRLNGTCKFMYEWVYDDILGNSSQPPSPVWTLWPNDELYKPSNLSWKYPAQVPMAWFLTPELREGVRPMPQPISQFVVLPILWDLETDFGSNDPWYYTHHLSGDDHPVIDLRRPPLQCWEMQTWSYRGWIGTLVDVREHKVPNLDLSDGATRVLEKFFDWKNSESRMGSPLLCFLGTLLQPLALESFSRMEEPGELDANIASASADIKRLVYGAHVMAKELFRSTVIDYGKWLSQGGDLVKNHSYNALRMDDGQPFPGNGDFVIYTESAATLRLEDMVAIPVVLTVSWLVVILLWWLVSRQEAAEGKCYSVCGSSEIWA